MEKVKAGLIGFGNIGTGVVKTFQYNAEKINEAVGKKVELVRIADVDVTTPRDIEVPPEILTSDYKDLINDPDIDIIIELIGGLHPAYEIVKEALNKGKSVVTANKALLAEYNSELIALAQKNNVALAFEASVGGGIPLIRTIRDGLAANNINYILGILNGTSNYILTKMYNEPDMSFEEILIQAQELGYAEADPTSDIEGEDAANKAAILASIAYGQKITLEDVYREGITRITPRDIAYTSELGYIIKLLAVIRKMINGVEVRVHPVLLPKEHILSSVDDVINTVLFDLDLIGNTMLHGPGAGALPTASSVLSDVIEIAKHLSNKKVPRFLTPYTFCKEKEIISMDEVVSGFYIRMQVYDRPGVLAAVGSVFARYEISIAVVLQKESNIGGWVPLIVLTHPIKDEPMKKALAEIQKHEDILRGEPFYIRILDV